MYGQDKSLLVVFHTGNLVTGVQRRWRGARLAGFVAALVHPGVPEVPADHHLTGPLRVQVGPEQGTIEIFQK